MEVSPPPKFRQGGVLVYLSWTIIIFVTVGTFALVAVSKTLKDDNETSKAEMMTVNSQAKMTLGSREVLGAPPTNVDDLNVGSLEQRYGIVLLKNEVSGAEAAEKLLRDIDDLVEKQDYEPSDTQLRLRRTIGNLLQQFNQDDWDTSKVSEEDRDHLVEQLGWIGEVGLAPPDGPDSTARQALLSEASNSFAAYMVVTCCVGCGGLLGVGAMITLGILLMNRKIHSHFLSRRDRSVVYLETFAIWIALFFVATQFALYFIGQFFEIEGTVARTALQLFIFFGSLGVLVWPMIRGLSFAQIREDIGWTCSNPFKEVAAGFFSYLALAPLIGLQLLVLVIVTSLTMQSQADSLAPTGGGSHPIQDQIATGDSTVWIGVFLLAVVAAPIVEETMFRGVFYRYLKDASNHRKLWISVAFASLVNGVIFAALHPQGLLGIPFLTTLAVGMSLARQWRDSLIASMTMHAINNGVLTCLMFAIF